MVMGNRLSSFSLTTKYGTYNKSLITKKLIPDLPGSHQISSAFSERIITHVNHQGSPFVNPLHPMPQHCWLLN